MKSNIKKLNSELEIDSLSKLTDFTTLISLCVCHCKPLTT
jgi:hypothetical protein